jgi:mannose-6-phosphate isomerase-like protein (cupin superfamily)
MAEQEKKQSQGVGIVLTPGSGKTIHVLGNPWTIKAGVEQTGGLISVLEGSFRPRTGAPAHIHHQHEETFYVLEGEFLFQMGTSQVKATAGTFVFVPRDVPHTFENIGTQPGKILGIMTPGGYEKFFEELAQLPPGPPDPAKFQEIFEKYDQEMVGSRDAHTAANAVTSGDMEKEKDQ